LNFHLAVLAFIGHPRRQEGYAPDATPELCYHSPLIPRKPFQRQAAPSLDTYDIILLHYHVNDPFHNEAFQATSNRGEIP